MDIQKSNYGYPKFSMIFGYPKIHWFLDIQKWIMDIQKSNYGYLNSVWFLDIQKCILGYPKIHWFLDIQKWIMDIQKSIYGYPKFSMIFRYSKMYFRISINRFLDIQKWIMDIQKSIYGYPKIHFWILVGWLCWGLTSQSTIFQSYRDGAIASWVSNQYFRGVKCLAQGHNTAVVGFEPRTSRSGVRHSTTEPPRSPHFWISKNNFGYP